MVTTVPDEIRYGTGAALLTLGAGLFLLGYYRKKTAPKYDFTDVTNKDLNVSKNRGMIFIYAGIAFFLVGISFMFISF